MNAGFGVFLTKSFSSTCIFIDTMNLFSASPESIPPFPVRRIGHLKQLRSAQHARLEAAAGKSVEVIQVSPDDPEPPEVDVLFGQVPPKWLVARSRLRWVQLESVGFDDYLDSQRSGVVLTNLHGLFAIPVAESAIAGVLSVFRGIDRLAMSQADRSWQKIAIRPTLRSLKGASILLVGYGSIARAIADRLSGFGCDISSYARSHPDADFHDLSDLDRALADAEVVIVTLPATPQTRGMFDAVRLGKLDKRAVLVNVGRADVLDEPALIDRLEKGLLGGAVLDVTQREPLPDDDPLWATPNVLLTQHTAGGNHNELDLKLDFFLENLRRFKRGERLESVVDLGKGY